MNLFFPGNEAKFHKSLYDYFPHIFLTKEVHSESAYGTIFENWYYHNWKYLLIHVWVKSEIFTLQKSGCIDKEQDYETSKIL